jgi:hypothetical protein
VDPKATEAWAAIQSIFSRLPQDYIQFVSGDVGVGAAYEALHRLHVMLVQEKSWDKVQERFGVTGGPGCMLALIDALSKDEGPTPVHPRVRAPLKVALMDFFLRIVGDNPVIRDSGTAAQALAVLTPAPFQSISSLFLGAFLAAFLRQEETSLSRLARQRLHEFSEAKANQVVASFESTYRGKPWKDISQVSFTHLFRVMQGEPVWLAEQLRRKLRGSGLASSAR